jgi:hypothetical protein
MGDIGNVTGIANFNRISAAESIEFAAAIAAAQGSSDLRISLDSWSH